MHESQDTQLPVDVEPVPEQAIPALPQIFYARKMSGLGITFSFLALLALAWMLWDGSPITLGIIIGLVFFIIIFIVNCFMYMRPYVTIGADYIQVFKRQTSFNQVVKYEDFAKGFVISFNAPPGKPKYEYDERLLISYNMMKEEDKTKLEYALREACLKALAAREARKKRQQ